MATFYPKKVGASLLLLSCAFGLIGDEEKETKQAESAWKGSVSAALNFTDGNTNSTNQRIAFDITRRLTEDALNVYGEYNDSSSEGATTVRNSTIGLKYDYSFSEKEYIFAGFELQKDKFKNLDLRNKAVFGYGYRVIDEEKTQFNAEFGGAWVSESYLADVDTDDLSYWAFRIGDKFSHQFESGVEIFQKGEYTPSLESSRDYTIESTQGIRTKLAASWSLENSVKITYVNNVAKDKLGVPIPRDNGRSVRRLDTQYYVGLTYSF